MKISKLNCTACGAPISIPDDLDHINCSACGTFLTVERGEGYVALKVAEKLTRAIESSGHETQAVIREGAQVTREELQYLRLTQEKSATEMKLANIQAEIRSLQRGNLTAIVKKQIENLRTNEYQALDHLRMIYLQSMKNDPKDLSESLKNIAWELDYLRGEIEVVEQTPQPVSSQVLPALQARKKELEQKAVNLKAQMVRNSLSSYAITDSPEDDQQKLAELCNLLDREKNLLAEKRAFPEGSVVYDEVSRRQQRVFAAWNKLERARIEAGLVIKAHPLESEEPAALAQYLTYIDQDLANLPRDQRNQAARDVEQALKETRKNVAKRLRELERQPQKKQSGTSPSLWTKINDAFAAPPSDLPAQAISSQAAQAGGFSALNDPFPAVLPASPTGSITAAVLRGVIWGAVLFFVIAVAGTVAVALAIRPQAGDPAEGTLVTALFSVLLIAFILGMRVFFEKAAPGTVIRGLFGLPDLVLSKPRAVNGIRSDLALRLLVGFFTLFSSAGLLFILLSLIPTDDQPIFTIVFLLGSLLTLAFSFLFASRSTHVGV